MVPRPFVGYSSMRVRLPKPFSVTTSRSWSSRAISTAITSSPLRSFMPATPDATRPIGRTSPSENRTAWPLRDTMRTSSLPSVRRTPISSSPSRILSAMMPSALSTVS